MVGFEASGVVVSGVSSGVTGVAGVVGVEGVAGVVGVGSSLSLAFSSSSISLSSRSLRFLSRISLTLRFLSSSATSSGERIFGAAGREASLSASRRASISDSARPRNVAIRSSLIAYASRVSHLINVSPYSLY